MIEGVIIKRHSDKRKKTNNEILLKRLNAKIVKSDLLFINNRIE